MMSEWQEVQLGDLIENYDSKRVPIRSRDRQPGPYPYYGASGITDSVADYLFDGEYLLIAEDGENVRSRNTPIAFMASGKFWVNNHAHIVRGISKADTKFLMYAIECLDVSGYITGSAQPKLSQSSMNAIRLRVPNVEEQRRIADILGSLDDKIELNRRMNQTLEETAKAIFKAWFVDFEPVKAKAQGATQYPGMPQDVFDQLPTRLVPSELGDIPEGWECDVLASMVDLLGGGTPKKAEASFWGGSIPWFSVKDAPSKGDVFVLDTELKITDLGLEKSSTKLLPEFTTIVSARGTVGKLGVVASPMAMNQSCYGVVGDRGAGPWFTYLNLQEAIESLRRNAHGGVFDTITRSTFDSIDQVRPNPDVLAGFEIVVHDLFLEILELGRESLGLAETRDTLLPKLLSGELSVAEAEAVA